MSIKIIQLTQSQLLGYLSVIRQSFHTVAETYGLPEENCVASGSFIKMDQLIGDFRRGVKLFGCLCDGVSAGYMQLEMAEPGKYTLDKVAVLPEYRGQGIGAQMVNYATAFAVKHGGQTLTISVFAADKSLIGWYESHGFILRDIIIRKDLPLEVARLDKDLRGLEVD
ncbi:MAG: GNAT family N-acetyltransferase [Clostridia bacterium]|nr:GNAT family N-acetyltransferase [Clostridia bacterium]